MQKGFEKIGIIYNPDINQAKDSAFKISQKLENSDIFSLDSMPEDIDLAIVVGGDGSFLKASRFYSAKSIALFGFNVGRLGYLAQAKIDEIDWALNKLKNKEYEIQDRMMIKADNNIALNDIVVKGEYTNRTATLDLYINDKKLCSYVADGLIISTPTGSTAYSLSAGGPIISPDVDCFLIIPICPHTLNTRPIVVPSSEKITVKAFESSQKLNISYDGQIDILNGNEINIEKNADTAKLLILNQQKDRFYDILKEKLHWSVAPKK